MKKVVRMAVYLGILSTLGCVGDNAVHQDGANDNLPFSVARSTSVERSTLPAQTAQLQAQSASVNNLSVDLYKQLIAVKNTNVFFSPYSISGALGMTLGGASGQTYSQMLSALRITLSGDDIHAAINGLDNDLMKYANKTDGITLNVVNASWMQRDKYFEPTYLDLISRYYGSGINLLDFATKPQESKTIINEWVSTQTKGKINDLLSDDDITAGTTLVLTNALYFLGSWMYKFDKEKTIDQLFYRNDNSTVNVPMMKLGQDNKRITLNYRRDRENHLRAIDLPYQGNRLVMTVILPDSGTFSDFESGITMNTIDTLLATMQPTELPPVKLPRFSFTSGSVSLKKTFKNLGMTDAFTPEADFSKIDGTKNLFIADIMHKAFIAVDESGSEAAAATAVILTESVALEPPLFVANRPFIFLIRDKETKVILFMGRILDPALKS